MFIISKIMWEYTDIFCHRFLFEVQFLFIFLQGFGLHWRILKQKANAFLYEINIKRIKLYHDCTLQDPLSLSKIVLVDINWTWTNKCLHRYEQVFFFCFFFSDQKPYRTVLRKNFSILSGMLSHTVGAISTQKCDNIRLN